MAWEDRAASWIESPDPVAPSRRRPLTTPLLLLLLNSVLGTVQAHVVCVALTTTAVAVVVGEVAGAPVATGDGNCAATVGADDARVGRWVGVDIFS